MDVSMNALAVEAENAYGKPIMSSFHGLWSVGGLTGATLGSLAAKTGLSAGTHLLVAALVLAAVVLAVARWLPRRPVGAMAEAGPSTADKPSAKAGYDRRLVGLGCIVFCAFLIEGAMADWSAVFLRNALGASAAQAALGYAAFSLTMTLMRLAGDHLVARWGAVLLLRVFNLAGAAALLLALLAADVGITMLAFALCGLGMATVAPTVFGAAARHDGQHPGRGIATMASFGYTGFLLGPPLIGWLAQAATLRVALGVLVLLSLAIVLLLPLLRGRARQDTAGGHPVAPPTGQPAES
jgi:predicted MFS family arabinose efflux permease